MIRAVGQDLDGASDPVPACSASSSVRTCIAVIDSGVSPMPQLLPGVDFTGSGDPRGWRDDCGHGTAVARQVLAIAPRARIVPLRVMDSYGALANPEFLSDAFQWIAAHASKTGIRTVCAAFGDPTYSQTDEPWRGTPLQRTLAELRAASIAVIGAAGNWYTQHRRRSPQGMAWPAILREIVSVGEIEETQQGWRLTDSTLRLHASCGTGCATTLFAPSGSVGETSGSTAVVTAHIAMLRDEDAEASVETLISRLVSEDCVIDQELRWPTLRRVPAGIEDAIRVTSPVCSDSDSPTAASLKSPIA